ncbi:TetR/AcrR family transcriptional regulator [Pseudonocardia sp. TRM90224]|uniref:TetR/AcrR family transcriptional regulator n=1 Tax=Pseudonocardia sp. TRM90224 TaxID=2812678 RepID=UPI001E30876E|nr:TetR/AcrR family transcriptional regulator [Pseudonocardia sp. TRM90224]
MIEARPVRRQARGEKRISEILDAALALFAENGYEATSTNAIAARAGMSPGSLYQFFWNKEAIAEALSTRMIEGLRSAHGSAFDADAVASLPLVELVNRMIDPLVAFNVANPGGKALFGNTDMPARLAEATRPLQDAVIGRVAAVLAVRAPSLPTADRERAALVAVQIVKAMMGPVVAADGAERNALTREMKAAVAGYLARMDEID